MKLSIVIPVFNGEDFDIRCLDGIYNLFISIDDFEVIVVDDCSTDNTYAKAGVQHNALAECYRQMVRAQKNVIFGGCLAEYKYYDMAPVVEKVMDLWRL